MRTCTKCNETKALSDFNKNRVIPGGYERRCKSCRRAWYRAKYRADPEATWTKSREWHRANRDKVLVARAAHAHKHVERKARWQRENPARVALKDRRRRRGLRNRTPIWLTPLHLTCMNVIYDTARHITDATGVRHVVDHIYPLQGETVSGLHVPENLQILSNTENLRKKNRMPEFL